MSLRELTPSQARSGRSRDAEKTRIRRSTIVIGDSVLRLTLGEVVVETGVVVGKRHEGGGSVTSERLY